MTLYPQDRHGQRRMYVRGWYGQSSAKYLWHSSWMAQGDVALSQTVVPDQAKSQKRPQAQKGCAQTEATPKGDQDGKATQADPSCLAAKANSKEMILMLTLILLCAAIQAPAQPKSKFQVTTHFDVTIHEPKTPKTCACAETGVCDCDVCDCPGGKPKSPVKDDEDRYIVVPVQNPPAVYQYQQYPKYQPIYQAPPTVMRFVPVSERRWVPMQVPASQQQTRSPQRPFGIPPASYMVQGSIPIRVTAAAIPSPTINAQAQVRHSTIAAQVAAPTPSLSQVARYAQVSSVAGCSASG